MDCCEPHETTNCTAACCVTKAAEPVALSASRFDARAAAIEELVAAIAGAGWTKERMS